jgi:hypothetical protein
MVHNEVVRSCRKIFITRNPLDSLVSQYFSFNNSHPYPSETTEVFGHHVKAIRNDIKNFEIDDYVVTNSWSLHGQFYLVRALLDLPSTKVLRYEDYIYDKKRMISVIADWFGLPLSDEQAAQIGARHDVIPAEDDPDNHIRQVHPGDARRKLKPATTSVLQAVFKDFMRYFRYD